VREDEGYFGAAMEFAMAREPFTALSPSHVSVYEKP
jgi:hypothetical protein